MDRLLQQIGYDFSDGSLLKLALTHPSLAEKTNNQRLEFLGDAVLGSIVSHLLYEMFPQEVEGQLARRHAALVCRDTLVEVAGQVGLANALLMANGEESAGGRQNPRNLEDAMEALIGAIYLDGGYDAARNMVVRFWQPVAASVKEAPKDAKTALQEWAQSHALPLPSYVLVAAEGPAHEPEFTVQVSVQGHDPVTATARSKRLAERMGAETLLRQLLV
ncbi:MAG: ribonuclease III [Alphaproteobacteria bacterium]